MEILGRNRIFFIYYKALKKPQAGNSNNHRWQGSHQVQFRSGSVESNRGSPCKYQQMLSR